MSLRTAAVFTVALVLVWSTAASASGQAPDHVTVRVYDVAGLRPALMRHALDGAGAIFRAAGIAVAWIDCPLRGAADARCQTPLAPGEVALRIVRLAPAAGQTGNVPLADAMIDGRLHSGVLATIYFDRVAAFAFTARTDAGVLLGRTAAHEIEHLLAGTGHHDAAGLMRPVWTVNELRHGSPGAWVLPAR